MDMNNVKAITLPNGGKVKKIKNNNGQTIWSDNTKYPYRQLEWINFNGDQRCDISSPWIMNKAYGINFIISATDPNVGGVLAGNNNAYDYGGWICNIQSNSQGMYFTYKVGNSKSPNYVYSDYFTENSERTLWTHFGYNLTSFDIRDDNGNIMGYDSLTTEKTFPGSTNVFIGANTDASYHYLKGVKIKSLKIADSTLGKEGIIVGDINSEILPCQRKSDGKLGFYITSDNTFHPLAGTTTSANIGPTVDEYPDKMSINF